MKLELSEVFRVFLEMFLVFILDMRLGRLSV